MMHRSRVTTQSEPSMAARRTQRRIKALTVGAPISVGTVFTDIAGQSHQGHQPRLSAFQRVCALGQLICGIGKAWICALTSFLPDCCRKGEDQ